MKEQVNNHKKIKMRKIIIKSHVKESGFNIKIINFSNL